MNKLSLIILIVIFISCKNESKNPESNEENVKSEILSSNSNKEKVKTNTSLKIVEPVKWTTKTNQISETDYELIIVANIEDDYHLYSQKVPENGPLPTVFIFEENDDYDLVGTTSEEEGRTTHDPTFDMEIKSFKNKAVFKQLVKMKKKNSKIMAEIEFMSCNDSQCLTGYSDIEFQI
ncbi:protein-disulfide reductase DsbD domain-containing protein [Gelidibacter gilvus]|uniref:Cytochrome C biogenesis protein n=1 Tax=Gelidibacter gilvus TaxID=59602 RepID=A0A4Q0XIV4_9FLAO|nr:protein-disulfide reductase DsbD domain-containing protein [Gelidibacter gilvus]RXJ50273.1 cytochrome C biogenesis protein [Gelidibacter gilvus]